MASMDCPKCGFRQDEAAECVRCGIVVAKYVPRQEPVVPSGLRSSPPKAVESDVKAHPGTLRKMFRVFRWAVLAFVVIVLFMVLHAPDLPEVDIDPASASRVIAAMRGLNEAARTGRSYRLVMNESDLNYWLRASLDMQGQPRAGQGITDTQKRAANRATGGALAQIPRQIGGPPAGAGGVEPVPSTASIDEWTPTAHEVQGAVHAVRINLDDDRVSAFLLFKLFGKSLTLELEGRLLIREGYLRMEPVSGHLGALPIPQSTLDSAVRRLFDSPENRENFRVDPHIEDIRIQDGQLVVDWR